MKDKLRRLEFLRRLRGHSQDGLSAITGVPRSRISELECGRYIPGPGSTELARLALALGISAGDAKSLLDEVDNDAD